MDSDERAQRRQDSDPPDLTADADTAAATLVGTNILGINAGTFPGGIAAPAAETAAAEAADTDDPALNRSRLTYFGGPDTTSGDAGVSPQQRELEAGELNG